VHEHDSVHVASLDLAFISRSWKRPHANPNRVGTHQSGMRLGDTLRRMALANSPKWDREKGLPTPDKRSRKPVRLPFRSRASCTTCLPVVSSLPVSYHCTELSLTSADTQCYATGRLASIFRPLLVQKVQVVRHLACMYSMIVSRALVKTPETLTLLIIILRHAVGPPPLLSLVASRARSATQEPVWPRLWKQPSARNSRSHLASLIQSCPTALHLQTKSHIMTLAVRMPSTIGGCDNVRIPNTVAYVGNRCFGRHLTMCP
jgi:hypothetical protein